MIDVLHNQKGRKNIYIAYVIDNASPKYKSH